MCAVVLVVATIDIVHPLYLLYINSLIVYSIHRCREKELTQETDSWHSTLVNIKFQNNDSFLSAG